MMCATKKRLRVYLIIGFLLVWLLGGCAKTRIGKIDLSDGKPPSLLKVGKTSSREVLEQIGEPFGYREQGDRSAMIYINFQEDYIFLLLGEIRSNKVYRLDLVFQNEILEKAEVRKEGWGFGANIDPQLLQLLAK